MSQSQPDYDVGIIGGGPGGSAMACQLARAGAKCVILERELFPRTCVGESLVPAANRVLKEIGFIDQMDECGFIKKHGAAWTATQDASKLHETEWKGMRAHRTALLHFREFRLPGVDRDYTWHVDRSEFDMRLLKHANEQGAHVIEGVRVSRVEFPENGDGHVRLKFDTGRREANVTCHMVVDASGRKTFLGNQLRHKVLDTTFDQYALYTWFEGYDRTAFSKDPNTKDYIFIHFMPITNTWVWQIPISETITSIGVVTQKKHFAKKKTDREKFFWDTLKVRPALYETVREAKQVHPLRDEADYSYAMKQVCGDRYVLIGDAARFVDPIFSSGISIAFASGQLASKDILKALESGDFSHASFADFETRLKWGVRNWYKFITLFYRLNVLFTAYIQDREHRLDVMKLLMGDVYDEAEPPVLTRMRETVQAVEQDEKHLWHDNLGELTASRFAETL